MKRATALFFVLIFLLLLFSSCKASTPTVSCREILQAMTDGEIGLPAGNYYRLNAPEGDPECLSDSLLSALLGSGAASRGWVDGALFLSLREHPCELAVVYCGSPDVASDTAKLFSARLRTIRVMENGLQNAEALVNATVVVRGNYVLYLLSSDPEAALAIAVEAMG